MNTASIQMPECAICVFILWLYLSIFSPENTEIKPVSRPLPYVILVPSMSTAGLAVHGMYYTDWYNTDLTLTRFTAQVDAQF